MADNVNNNEVTPEYLSDLSDDELAGVLNNGEEVNDQEEEEQDDQTDNLEPENNNLSDETNSDEKKEDESSSDAETQEEKFVRLEKEEYDKLLQQIEEQRRFIGKQSNEVGNTRKMLSSILEDETNLAVLRDKLGIKKESSQEDGEDDFDSFLENPKEAITSIIDKREEERLKIIEQQKKEFEERNAIVSNYAPDMVDNAKEIVRILKDEDGFTPEAITNFVDNIAFAPIDLLLNLNDRARKAKKIRELEEKLKTGGKVKKDEISKKIAKLEKDNLNLSSMPGTTKPINISQDKVSPEFLADMTDEELKEFSKKLKI